MAFLLTFDTSPVIIRVRPYSIVISWSTDVPENVMTKWEETLAKYNLTSVIENAINRRETVIFKEFGQADQLAQQLKQQLNEQHSIEAEIIKFGWQQVKLPELS